MELRGIEPRTSPMLREYYTTKPQPLYSILCQSKGYIVHQRCTHGNHWYQYIYFQSLAQSQTRGWSRLQSVTSINYLVTYVINQVKSYGTISCHGFLWFPGSGQLGIQAINRQESRATVSISFIHSHHLVLAGSVMCVIESGTSLWAPLPSRAVCIDEPIHDTRPKLLGLRSGLSIGWLCGWLVCSNWVVYSWRALGAGSGSVGLGWHQIGFWSAITYWQVHGRNIYLLRVSTVDDTSYHIILPVPFKWEKSIHGTEKKPQAGRNS